MVRLFDFHFSGLIKKIKETLENKISELVQNLENEGEYEAQFAKTETSNNQIPACQELSALENIIKLKNTKTGKKCLDSLTVQLLTFVPDFWK